MNAAMNFAARLSLWSIRHRLLVCVVVGLITLGFAVSLVNLDIRTRFSDMVPHDHPYVKVHQKYQDSFAASNRVTILVKAKEGDIFREDVLGEVRRITYDLQQVEGVNPMQITSLASKKLKRVNASSEGIETRPLMWPDLPKDAQQMRELRQAVLNNPLVYGLYVDRDLSSALIQVDVGLIGALIVIDIGNREAARGALAPIGDTLARLRARAFQR